MEFRITWGCDMSQSNCFRCSGWPSLLNDGQEISFSALNEQPPGSDKKREDYIGALRAQRRKAYLPSPGCTIQKSVIEPYNG